MLGGAGGGGDDATDLLLQVVPRSNLECAIRTWVQHLQLEELGEGGGGVGGWEGMSCSCHTGRH